MNNSIQAVPVESEAMLEIRQVRRHIHEKVSDMTPEERCRYYEDGSKRFKELADKLAEEQLCSPAKE